MYIPCTIALIILLTSFGIAQPPYLVNRVMSLNNSEAIAIYSSPTLIRVITQKDQIFTFELIRNVWSLTGTRLLNSNAERISFSANGDMILYKAHIQLPAENWWKTYWIGCSCYFINTGDVNILDVTFSKLQRHVAYTYKSGAIAIYTLNGASQAIYQTLDYPLINQYT